MSAVVPEMDDYANIQTALNHFYGNQGSGIKQELSTLETNLAGLSGAFASRKATKLHINANQPGDPLVSNNFDAALWVDTDEPASSTAMGLLRYWDGSSWVVVNGMPATSPAYTWTGNHTFSNNTVALTGTGTLSVAKAASFTGGVAANTLNVSGATTLVGNTQITTGTFTVSSGNTTLKNTSVQGTLGATGATALGSTLGVAGATTLSSTLVVAGLATANNGLTVAAGTTNLKATAIAGNVTMSSGLLTLAAPANHAPALVIGTRKVFIQSTAPTGASAQDIWIKV